MFTYLGELPAISTKPLTTLKVNTSLVKPVAQTTTTVAPRVDNTQKILSTAGQILEIGKGFLDLKKPSQTTVQRVDTPQPSSIDWKKILLITGGVGVAGFLAYRLTRKKKGASLKGVKASTKRSKSSKKSKAKKIEHVKI